MRKDKKIALGILGGITVLSGLFWVVLSIYTHISIYHAFDDQKLTD